MDDFSETHIRVVFPGEGMWLKRISEDENGGTGVLDNVPSFVDLHDARYGDTVRYRYSYQTDGTKYRDFDEVVVRGGVPTPPLVP